MTDAPARTGEATGSCRYAWLGRVEYEQAWELQRRLGAERSARRIPDTLLLLEHPPVYTTGRRRDGTSNLRLPREMLGAPLLQVDRGGDVTFHGPGQLIAYPVVELRGLGVVEYVRNLEEVIIRTLADCGIEAGRECGLTGVWAGREKIAAIGVRVSRPGGPGSAWVTGHGLALNVSVDLAWFERIVPCGIADRGVTSIARHLGDAPSLAEVAERLAHHFRDVYGLAMTAVDSTEIR